MLKEVNHSEDELHIFVKFVENIVENSYSMPGEFMKLVNENFWDLV